MIIEFKNNKTIIENYEFYTLPTIVDENMDYINPEHYCILDIKYENVTELLSNLCQCMTLKDIDLFNYIAKSDDKIKIKDKYYELIEVWEYNAIIDKVKLKQINE